MNAIQMINISKSYGSSKHKILNDLSFTVPNSGISLYLGPNGAGKTTTFRILAGIIQPESGEMKLLGAPPQPQIREKMAVTIEEARFYPHLSGRDNLTIVSKMRNIQDAQWVDKVLDMVGLLDSSRKAFGKYSQGMKQRLYIASCLIPDLELLILDEPTNGLDIESRTDLWRLLSNLRDKGVTIFISTHQAIEAEKFAQYVVMIDKGRCFYQGDRDDLFSKRGMFIDSKFKDLLEENAIDFSSDGNNLYIPNTQVARVPKDVIYTSDAKMENIEELYQRMKSEK